MSNASDINRETPIGRSDHQSALFSSLIMQQFSMAMMLMGRTQGPEGEKAPKDLEAAQLFIDQLEMLEAKTKGNLSKDEEGLLKQSLMSLRMSFVEAVEEGNKPKASDAAVPEGPASATPAAEPAPNAPEESHKKFTKKY